MATRVLDDAFFSWDSVDLSDHVKSVTLNYEAEALDDTVMGDDTRSNKGGLKDWSIEVELLNDEASSSVAQTFFSAVGTTATVLVRPDNSEGVGATNPNYSGTGMLQSFPPLGGGVGELSTTTVSIVSAGTLSRATS